MLQRASIDHQRGKPCDDHATAIIAIPASARQRKIALGAFILLIVLAVINAPFSLIQLGHAHSFVPILEAFMCAANLLTALLLFAQYAMYPQRALLVLAGGFVFSGLFALLYTLAFPSVHSSAVLIGDKYNSPTWLFFFWQTTFSLAVIVYALSKDRAESVKWSGRLRGVEIGVTITCVVMMTAAMTWVATAGVGYLPPLHQTLIRRTPFAVNLTESVTLLNAAALAVLFVRGYTLLDEWLKVTLAAWLPNLVMASLFDSIRFTEVWYLSRVWALFAGSSLLVVLLTETLLLHRRYGQHQQELIAELDHRVKNILAQVAVVATSTREGSRSIDEFLGSLNGRIQSMATAHTLLSRSGWQSVGLDAVVRNQMAPYLTSANMTIGGPDIMLTAAEIQAVSRVLHELATNAAKYGALSIPGGQVSVHWDLKPNGALTHLTLFWREFGGPPVAAEHPSGYGTSLIRDLIPHELAGTVDLAFAKAGVSCRIEIPIRREIAAVGAID